MRRSKRIQWMVLSAIVLIASTVLAVSPKEIEKMRAAAPDKPTVAPQQPRSLLIFNRCEGFKHSSIPYISKALEIMGEKTAAYQATVSEDMAVFEARTLNQFDAVCFNNTTALKFENPTYRQNLMDFVKGGKGIVGIHGATDNFYNWPEAAKMFGGTFAGHPWGHDRIWGFKIEDPSHPVVAAFQGKDFNLSDEIYTYHKLDLRNNARVLLSLNFMDEPTRNIESASRDIPVSWVRDFGKGRVFYCSLGHNHDLTWNPVILRHYLDGIQFALGDLQAETTPLGPDLVAFDRLLRAIKQYDYTDSRVMLSEIDALLFDYYSEPEFLKSIEKRFIMFLQSDASLPAKQFICRKLRVIGTEQCVDALGEMLTDQSTSDMARYAMEKIESPQVDVQLTSALRQTSGIVRIGIINSLGARRADIATDDIARLIGSDPETTSAALNALGKIACQKCVRHLAGATRRLDGALQEEAYAAYLAAADTISDEDTRGARKIYDSLYDSTRVPMRIRAAALRGRILTDERKAADLITRAMKSSEPVFQTTAIMMLREIKDSTTLQQASRMLDELSPRQQIQLITALADGGQKQALPAVVKAADSDEESVRIAALTAMQSLGDQSLLGMLVERAVETTGAERDMARQALYSIRDKAASDRIVDMIPDAATDAKKELITAVGERRIESAVPTLMKTAFDSDRAVRLESLKVLRKVAAPEHTKDLIALLLHTSGAAERREAEKTVIAVAQKADDVEAGNQIVLQHFQQQNDPEKRTALLRVLGGIASDASLPVLRDALQSPDPNIRRDAIRVLSGWPNARPKDDLFEVARTATDSTDKVLALRGYIQQVKTAQASPTEKIEMYQKAMNLASNTNEKRMVLSGLGETGTASGMQMATQYLHDPDLKPEAELAILQNAETTCATHHQKTEDLLLQIVESTQSDVTRQKAKDILQKIFSLEGHIATWKSAGPYKKEGVNAHGLFDTPFPPEIDPDSPEVNWKIIAAMTNPGQPWMVDFTHYFEGGDLVIYVRTKVWSLENQEVVFETGSDDGIKVWLNGTVIYQLDSYRPVQMAEDRFEGTLQEGWNDLLVKIPQAGGGWGVAVRMLQPDGKRIPGLIYSTEDF